MPAAYSQPKLYMPHALPASAAFLVPLAGLVIILGDAIAVRIQHAQVVHSVRVAGVGRHLIPLAGLAVIPGHAPAVIVQP
jgi:hypothetical protein